MAAIIDKAKDVLSINKTSDTVTLAGREINSTGYGLMLLTWRPNPPPIEQSIATMKAALDAGANFWNAGTFYGTPEFNSLHLLREYFTKYPEDADKVVLSIKGATKIGSIEPDGTPESIKRAIKYCNDFLVGKKKLDIFEAARVDPNTPIEITMKALDQEIEAGNLGAISLSECSADTIRRAAKVTKIAAVEVEVSLWATEIFDNGVAKACAEHDITVIAYSPLGRGFLTGSIKSADDLPEGDMRRHQPRFQPGNFEKNLELVDQLKTLAGKKGATAGQVALAWIKAQGRKPGNPTIVPIPGSSTPERLRENMVNVELSDMDIKEIDSIVASVTIEGGRYPKQAENLLFGSTPALTEGAMEAVFAGK
ncbi:Aldo/keto reductase [Polychaeton citri CBS 116435]|uniref:Aldo/keto reductase n=1 Tax=Polychaeton citri CBS 116435 TaxID=1314669 RepID=A0A9P4QD75_9PEZI|nr:Aldo/keto reductase [Polychaeton citri CBS 116435]